MSIKMLTRLKFALMIIFPVIIEIRLIILEWRRAIYAEMMFPAHAALYIFLVISIIRYIRRCRECGAWCAVKEISREEINRMLHPNKNPNRNVYQVRYNVMKQCKLCGKVRPYEIVREVKEK